jgi:hypothetical protein
VAVSWDVLLLRLGPEITTIAELENEGGDPLGSTDDVRRLLADVLPALDLSDPAWAILESANYSIEFNIGTEEPCTAVMLHVRGLDDALEPIREVCSATGWRAFDCSDGELIDFKADPARGLRAWREYQNRVSPGGPVKGISLTTPDGKRVYFDHLQPQVPTRKAQKRRWWQLWKPRA